MERQRNLKNRVTSYFRENPDHTPKVAAMVSNVYDYDYIVVDSEYEALLLECALSASTSQSTISC